MDKSLRNSKKKNRAAISINKAQKNHRVQNLMIWTKTLKQDSVYEYQGIDAEQKNAISRIENRIQFYKNPKIAENKNDYIKQIV